MKVLINHNYYKLGQIFKTLISKITPKITQTSLFNKTTFPPKKSLESLSYSFSSYKNLKNNHNLIIQKNKFTFSQQNDDKPTKSDKEKAFEERQEQLLKSTPDEDPYTYQEKGGSGKYVFGFGVLCLTGIIAYVQYKQRTEEPIIQENIAGLQTVVKTAKSKVGGQWSLVDMNGNNFSSRNLQGAYYIIYFGFTKCPDICPATLYKLSRAMKLIQNMPQSQYINLKLVFVSVDPQRDSPQKLRNYLKNFDAKIIGVTGLSNDDAQLKACMKNFRIYSNKVELQNKEYSIDHTTICYLMDDMNQYVDHLNPNLTQKQLSKFLVNQILRRDQKRMKAKQKQGKA